MAVWASSTTLSSAEPPPLAPTTSSDNTQLRTVSRRDTPSLSIKWKRCLPVAWMRMMGADSVARGRGRHRRVEGCVRHGREQLRYAYRRPHLGGVPPCDDKSR